MITRPLNKLWYSVIKVIINYFWKLLRCLLSISKKEMGLCSLSKSPSVCSFQEAQSQSTVTLLLCRTGFLSSPGSAIIPLLPLLRPNINSNYRRLLATIKPFGEEAAHVWPFNLSLRMDQQTTTQMDQHTTTAYNFLFFYELQTMNPFLFAGPLDGSLSRRSGLVGSTLTQSWTNLERWVFFWELL